MSDRVGEQVGHYRLLSLLGAGGFAEVYLGAHIHLGTQAAIKLLHAQLASERDIELFRAEARTVAALTHPHIVRVLDFGTEGGAPYLVMDYAPNGNLRQRFPQGVPQAPLSIVPYVRQVAEALSYAHQQRLIHRDIKPENMLLGRRNEVLLSDFGLAVTAQNSGQQSTQAVIGTVAYMAPEQLQGKPRPASDLYSLGIVVYEWLTGTRPFQGAYLEIASQHVLTPAPPLRQFVSTLSPLIEEIVLAALAKDPKDRFATPLAFANALEQACRQIGERQQPFTMHSPAAPPPARPQPVAQEQPPSIHFSPTQVTPTPPGAEPSDAAVLPPTFMSPSVAHPPMVGNQEGVLPGLRQEKRQPYQGPSVPIPPRPRRLRTVALASLLILVLVTGGGAAWIGYLKPHFFPTTNLVRGSIYDRNGILLAYSEPNSSVSGGYRRRYCFPSLSPVIGYVIGRQGKAGIEAALDQKLAAGNDLYLTIDWRVQNLIDEENDITYDEPGGVLGTPLFALARGTIGAQTQPRPSRCDQTLVKQMYIQPAEGTAHSHGGSIIVEDPHTGEILGMLSRPYFDADQITDPASGNAYLQKLTKDQYTPLLIRPTQGRYAPASTIMTLTLSAALDTGAYALTDSFGGNNCLAQNSEARSYTVNGHTFQDTDLATYNPSPSCPIDLEHGYIYSDNIIYARVGVDLGAATWFEYAQGIGIVDGGNPHQTAIPFDLPVTPSNVDLQGISNEQANLAAAAFGQDRLAVTPLTMALLTSTVANNGTALQPLLLYKLVPPGTNAKDVAAPSKKHYGDNPLMSAATAQSILQSMRGVVQQGSAGLIANSRANVGGQTGTAYNAGADPDSWFISLAPDVPGQTPQWVVVVQREEGDDGFFQAPVADCIYLHMPGQTALPNVHDGTAYPLYHCAP